MQYPTSRRRMLGTLSAALGAPAVLALAPAGARAEMASMRTLRLQHLHTGEKLSIEYFSGGRYLPHALEAVNHLLRDFRTGEAGPMAPALFDLLHDLAVLTETRHPFEVISAYRSPQTNAALRARSSGVASGSLHLQGKAIDIRLADVPLATLRDAALSLRRGGVGYYPASRFVHVDIGRVRRW